MPCIADIAPLSHRPPAPHTAEVSSVSIRPPILNASSTPPSVHAIYQQRQHQQQQQQQQHHQQQQQQQQQQHQQQQQQQQQQQASVARDLAAALDQEMQLMAMQRLGVLQKQNSEQQDTIRQLKARDRRL